MCGPLEGFTTGGTWGEPLTCPGQASGWVDTPSLYAQLRPTAPETPRYGGVAWIRAMAAFIPTFLGEPYDSFNVTDCGLALHGLACAMYHTPCGYDCQPVRMCASTCNRHMDRCLDTAERKVKFFQRSAELHATNSISMQFALATIGDPGALRMMLTLDKAMQCVEPFADTSPGCMAAAQQQPVPPTTAPNCSAPRLVG